MCLAYTCLFEEGCNVYVYFAADYAFNDGRSICRCFGVFWLRIIQRRRPLSRFNMEVIVVMDNSALVGLFVWFVGLL